ncbi:hypothetical protein BDA99DRAFT_447552, partial [Phascolomyces articulosus]
TIPTATSRFNRAQSHDDNIFCSMQYQMSSVFRPLDVSTNELLQILPQDQLTRLFIILC